MADFNDYKGVWVFCEQRQGKLMPTDFELVSEARKLADELNCEVTGLLLGDNVEGIAKELGGYGADKVMVCESPLLKDYTTDAYTKVLCDMVNEYKPEALLIGATNIGRDLGPRCAARLHTGLTADATHLDVDTAKYVEFLKESSTIDLSKQKFDYEDRNLKMTRPAFGGHLMATIICPRFRPQMSTVRPGVMKKAPFDQAKADACQIVKPAFSLTADDIKTEVLSVEKAAEKLVDLIGADVIVSVGRGISKDVEGGIKLAEELAAGKGVYTTHLRSEFEPILEALDEAFRIGRHGNVPVVVSHHKCAGAKNWGRTKETLAFFDEMRQQQDIACDCYPYSASSSTLDMKQVTDEFDIVITWSEAQPEQAGKTLQQIADEWQVSLHDAAARLMPAGAIYHNMDEQDVRRVMRYPVTMIGSDGLPNDPMPHPRLWGAFPRVLGHYSRDEQLFPLTTAVHKMTGLSAARFQLADRGLVKIGYFADLVLFDPQTVRDVASFSDPKRPADGIEAVMVNGVMSYGSDKKITGRAGRFLRRRMD